MRRRLLVALLLCIAAVLRADSIQTKPGDRVKGRVVREDKQQVVFRTEYGELTIPRADIKKHERSTYVVTLADGSELVGQVAGEEGEKLVLRVGETRRTVPLAEVKSVTEKKPPPRPKTLSPQQLLQMHRRVLEHFGKKQYDAALAECKRILKSQPDDDTALYNAACACARMGKRPEALDYLRKAVEAGFVNFVHVGQDSDLESLRDDAAYKELLAKKEHYVEQAATKAIERITKSLAQRGIDAKRYHHVFDKERNFVYLHAKSEEEFAELRRGLEAYAAFQWRTLFQNRPQRPLYIVAVTAKDSAKVFRGRAKGWYNAGANALFCSDMPVHKLLKTDVVIHEFTHALHFADMMARHQQHPLWLIEGLATLFEASDRNGSVVPHHSYRLLVVQQAVQQRRDLPWKTLMSLDPGRFMRLAQLAYAQSRYMLFYMYEKGLLKRFYDEYTAKENYAGDRSALASFEVVFGKPIELVERDWKQWVMKQKVPPVPFLGVQTREDKGRLVVAKVSRGSPAAKAGIRAGDTVVALGGQPVSSPTGLLGAIAERQVGEKVEIELLREKKKQTVAVTLGRRRDLASQTRKPVPYLGLTVEQKENQVLIREVAKNSPGEKAGLKPGLAIVEFNGKKLSSARQYLTALRAGKPGKEVTMRVTQGEDSRTVKVTPAALPR